MADKTVPVEYRRGKLRAGGLGSLATLKKGGSGQLVFIGENGPAYGDLTDLLDSVIGDDQGTMIYRDADEWKGLAPGTSGQFFKTQGAGANPVWASVASPPVWQLIETRTVNGVEDFTDLDDYQVIRVMIAGLSALSGGRVAMRVSTDNGANFLGTSGDYYIISGSNGAKTNTTEYPFHSTAGVLSNINGDATIHNFSLASPKPITASNGALGYTVATTTKLNAVRIFDTAGTLSSAGTIYLLGLPGI